MKRKLKHILFIMFSTVIFVLIAYLFLYFQEDKLNFIEGFGTVSMVFASPFYGAATGGIFLLVNRFLIQKFKNKSRFYLTEILMYIFIAFLLVLPMFITDYID